MKSNEKRKVLPCLSARLVSLKFDFASSESLTQSVKQNDKTKHNQLTMLLCAEERND